MANFSKVQGTLNLIGVYLVDGDPVQAKTQEISKITHFVDTLDEQVHVTIDVRKKHRLITANGESNPTSIGSPTNKGTTYTYSQNGFFIEVKLKKMVGTLTYTKEDKR